MTPAKWKLNQGHAQLAALALVAIMTIGCDKPEARFRLNMVFLDRQERDGSTELTATQIQDVQDILTALFGTPDQPHIPRAGDSGINDLFTAEDEIKLAMAAGPVGIDQHGMPRGLYRQHCAHCHGISGDGTGPTAAFLNPYPRDYRLGIFKFKSTPRGRPPTHDDLRRILIHGISDTAMPSFRLLADDEIDALVTYVKYLSIRGMVERNLMRETALELVDDERLDTSSAFLLDEVLATVVRPWAEAESQATPVPLPAMNEEQRVASVERGRQLYYGVVANCVKCHGDTQLGDGQTNEYDDWTKVFADWTNTDPVQKKRLVSELIALGGLEPRNIIPRNLRLGIYRGGRRPLDLYRRIRDGIDGTPMPASTMKPEGAPADAQGLTSEDIWHLVHYVQSLPYESLSQPRLHTPVYMRERM